MHNAQLLYICTTFFCLCFIFFTGLNNTNKSTFDLNKIADGKTLFFLLFYYPKKQEVIKYVLPKLRRVTPE